MATLTTSKVASTVQTRAGIDITTVYAEYTVAANLALNDVIQMVKVPAGARIIEMILSSTDLDSNGTPLMVYDVGDGNDTDRFIDGSIIGRTGGVDRLGVGILTATHLYTYTAEDTIDVLVQVGPATGVASGTVSLMVIYTMAQ